MASTYEKIATTTLTTSASSVTFSSISGAYTDLIFVSNVIDTNGLAYNGWYRVNGDTGSNYSRTSLYADGSTTYSNRGSSQTKAYFLAIYGDLSQTAPTVTITNFNNYSNTTTYKTFITRTNLASDVVGAHCNLWRSISAINQIELGLDSGSFATGSTFTLYGILKA